MEANQKILDYFSSLKKMNRLATSYIFAGRELLLFSRTIAKLVNCKKSEHFCGECFLCRETEKSVCADIMVVDETPSIKMEHIRAAQKFLSMGCVNLEEKVLIINNAHYLRDEAANAFLKTLEEPPRHSLILLLTSRIDNILPTIISRCRKIYFPSCQEYDFSDVSIIEEFLKGRTPVLKERAKARAFFMDLIVFLRDTLVYRLTVDRKKLLAPGSCEIIQDINVLPEDIFPQLKRALEVYNDLDTINLNLAANLMRVAFG